MKGFDKGQPRDELGRWTSDPSKSKVIAFLKKKGRLNIRSGKGEDYFQETVRPKNHGIKAAIAEAAKKQKTKHEEHDNEDVIKKEIADFKEQIGSMSLKDLEDMTFDDEWYEGLSPYHRKAFEDTVYQKRQQENSKKGETIMKELKQKASEHREKEEAEKRIKEEEEKKKQTQKEKERKQKEQEEFLKAKEAKAKAQQEQAEKEKGSGEKISKVAKAFRDGHEHMSLRDLTDLAGDDEWHDQLDHEEQQELKKIIKEKQEEKSRQREIAYAKELQQQHEEKIRKEKEAEKPQPKNKLSEAAKNGQKFADSQLSMSSKVQLEKLKWDKTDEEVYHSLQGQIDGLVSDYKNVADKDKPKAEEKMHELDKKKKAILNKYSTPQRRENFDKIFEPMRASLSKKMNVHSDDIKIGGYEEFLTDPNNFYKKLANYS